MMPLPFWVNWFLNRSLPPLMKIYNLKTIVYGLLVGSADKIKFWKKIKPKQTDIKGRVMHNAVPIITFLSLILYVSRFFFFSFGFWKMLLSVYTYLPTMVRFRSRCVCEWLWWLYLNDLIIKTKNLLSTYLRKTLNLGRWSPGYVAVTRTEHSSSVFPFHLIPSGHVFSQKINGDQLSYFCPNPPKWSKPRVSTPSYFPNLPTLTFLKLAYPKMYSA